MTPEEATQVDFDPFDISKLMGGRRCQPLETDAVCQPCSQDLAPWSIPHARGRCPDPQQEPRG